MSLDNSKRAGSGQSDSPIPIGDESDLPRVTTMDKPDDDHDDGRSSENSEEHEVQSHEEMTVPPERMRLQVLIEEDVTDGDALKSIEDALKSVHSTEERMAIVNTPILDESKETPLHIAAREGFLKVAKLLLDNGAEVNAKDGSEAQPLHRACEEGHEELVKALCEHKDTDVTQKDEDGWYPIHLAIWARLEADTIQLLLGSDNKCIDEKARGAGWTPLNMAVYRGYAKLASTLLEHGANPAIQDADGWTPLMAAAKRRHYNIFDHLLSHLKERGREDIINTQDNQGKTVLMELFAATVNDEQSLGELRASITKLLELRPTVDVTDDGKETVLHYAISFAISINDSSLTLKTIDLAKDDILLLKDEQGKTALDIALDAIPSASPDADSDTESPHQVLDAMIRRLKDGNLRNELLCLLVQREAMYGKAKDLLSAPVEKDEIDKNLDHDKWGLVEWLIFYGLSQVLMSYVTAIRENGRNSDHHNFEDNREVREKIVDWLGKQEHKTKNAPLPIREREKRKDNRGSEDGAKDEGQVLRDIKDILDFYLVEATTRSEESTELSKPEHGMKDSLKRFDAAVIQMRQDDRGSTRFVKFRTVGEVVYQDVRLETVGATIKRFQELLPRPHDSAEPPSQGAEGFGGEFTWIHLPCTNVSLPVN